MRKIYILLMSIMIIALAGCSSNNVKYSNENYKSDSKKDSDDDSKQESKEFVNIEETYPQSIEYFKAIDQLESIENKGDATTLLRDLQEYILEKYPYDYSQAKDQAILDTVEDFGIMERFLITNEDHMFYEATNHKSTIGLNYYVESGNDLRTNNIKFTTYDFQLQKEICKNNSNELKIHTIYESLLEDLEKNSNIDIKNTVKQLEEISTDSEKKEMNEDTIFYQFSIDKEHLLLTYSESEGKITNLRYSNMESADYESVYVKDGKVEISIILNKLEDLSEQKKLFDKVLGI